MKTAINPLYPVEAVDSVDDLMALAVSMEHEAGQRYTELAAEMRRLGEAEMAMLFEDLAALEQQHEDGLADWARREGRTTPPRLAFSWQMPETMGPEGQEGRLLTPYKALSIAVRNEERAFTFYSYLAAMAETPEVRDRAEGLAREELNHVAQLRAMRRQAYHSGGSRGPRRRPVTDVAALHRLAAGLEAGSYDADAAAAAALDAGGHGVESKAMARLAAEDRRAAERLAPPAGTPSEASSVVAGARDAGLLHGGSLTAVGALQLALRNAEEVLESYMAQAEYASDESVMREAQRLGELAVARLAVVRSLLADVED